MNTEKNRIAKNQRSLTLLIALTTVLSGCGLELGNGKRVNEPQTYSLDGVKWISPDVNDGGNKATFTQSTYLISSSGRLLMRFENLGGKVGDISLGDNRKVEVQVTLDSGENATAAATTLRLCPVTKNWMMLATWRTAYPMGTSGGWNKDGSDYETSECVTGTVSTPSAREAYTTLRFDVTNWIVNTVKGRGINYGLVLLSEDEFSVRVRGDADASYSPRITWIQSR